MELAVAGATGRSGVPFVEQALAAGHTVRALVRSPEKASRLLPTGSDGLALVVGDLLDRDAVGRLVQGADAVLDLTGPVKGGPDDLRTEAAQVVLPACEEAGVRRFVALTGAGVVADGDRPKLVDKVVRRALMTVEKQAMASATEYTRAVASSGLDWTVVRGPRLTEGDARGRERTKVLANVGPDSGTQVSRADLATALLDMVEQGTWVRQMPVVTW